MPANQAEDTRGRRAVKKQNEEEREKKEGCHMTLCQISTTSMMMMKMMMIMMSFTAGRCASPIADQVNN